MTLEQINNNVDKLAPYNTIRVHNKTLDDKEEWTITISGIPAVTGFDTEAQAWRALAALCLMKSLKLRG